MSFVQRKLAKFDGSQVCTEMPCFKRQTADEGLSLDLCVCAQAVCGISILW